MSIASPPASQPGGEIHRKVLQSIPDDALAAYVFFSNGVTDAGTTQMINSLLATASLTGLLSGNQQIVADILSSAVTIGKHPHAIFLLDIGCRKLGEGSFTLDDLSLGGVIHAPVSEHGKLLVQLKRVIDRHFNAEDSELAWVGEGAYRRQRLTSEKFPEWCVWEWGSVGETFIFTVGTDAYDSVITTLTSKDRSLDNDPLMELCVDMDQDIDQRFLMLYINQKYFRQSLRPVMGHHYDKVVKSLSADELDQLIYSAGFIDRAYISRIYTRYFDEYYSGLLTGDFSKGDPRSRAVPPQAEGYGVGYSDISKAIGYCVEMYLSSRNPYYRDKLEKNYARFADSAGVGDLEPLLMKHFGPEAMVIVHDWPRHPLNIPVARTLVVQFDADPAFKGSFDKILRTWQQMLRAMSGEAKRAQPASAWESLFELQLNRTSDGVWYLHIGPLVLAAGGIDQNFLVLSHSISAVQMNLHYLGTAFGQTGSKALPRVMEISFPGDE